MSALARWGCAAFFAVVGFLLVGAAELGLLLLIDSVFSARLAPRGAGWILLPIAGAVAGWRLGFELDRNSSAFAINLRNFSRSGKARSMIVIVLGWAAIWWFYATTFDDDLSGSYWSHSDWIKFWKGLIFPPAALFAGAAAFRWVKRGD